MRGIREPSFQPEAEVLQWTKREGYATINHGPENMTGDMKDPAFRTDGDRYRPTNGTGLKQPDTGCEPPEVKKNTRRDSEMAEEVKELTPEERAVRNDLLDRIEHTINKIRPYIQADGGDVQLIDYEDGVVTVSMLGACAGCMAIDTTLNEGIQALLMDEIPEVKKVQMLQASPYGFF